MKPKNLFNFFAKAEGVTWTLLLAALVARAITDLAPWVLTVVGSIHGAVFLGYGVTAALVGVNQRWRVRAIVFGIVLAIIPFATIPFEINRNKSGSLEGPWRLEATQDPRDSGWFDRLFRWFIRRPIVLVVLLLTLIGAIFSLLLWLGPPDTWSTKFN